MQNISRVICFDLHASQIQGFFGYDTLFDNLFTEPYFIKYNLNYYSILNENNSQLQQ